VPNPPSVGYLIVVSGTAEDNGTTVRAQKARRSPRTGD
jgi:hypothetical protein